MGTIQLEHSSYLVMSYLTHQLNFKAPFEIVIDENGDRRSIFVDGMKNARWAVLELNRATHIGERTIFIKPLGVVTRPESALR